MDLLTVVIVTVIGTLGVCGILFAYVNSRKNGEQGIPWDKIRPILSEVFAEIVKLIQSRALGYQGIEDYAVTFIKEKVDSATFISPVEKTLLSETLIRSIIAPRLKELYSEKVSMKRIGE